MRAQRDWSRGRTWLLTLIAALALSTAGQAEPSTAPSPKRGESRPPEERLRAEIPRIAVSVSASPLYFGYDLTSSQLANTVYWHLLEPTPGAALRLEAWPLIWAGLDLQARLGRHRYDVASIVDQSEIRSSIVDLQAHLRARYVLDRYWRGLAAGARLGYRGLLVDVSEQSPLTILPSVTAHLPAPGLELRAPLHPRWLVCDFSVEVFPLGLYGEAPDSPGDPQTVGVWGWRADAAARSILYRGLFIELQVFTQHLYASYRGTGDRLNISGEPLQAARITTDLRGFSLGLGFAY